MSASPRSPRSSQSAHIKLLVVCGVPSLSFLFVIGGARSLSLARLAGRGSRCRLAAMFSTERSPPQLSVVMHWLVRCDSDSVRPRASRVRPTHTLARPCERFTCWSDVSVSRSVGRARQVLQRQPAPKCNSEAATLPSPPQTYPNNRHHDTKEFRNTFYLPPPATH